MNEIASQEMRRRSCQSGFLNLLPRIERLLKFEFRRLRPRERDEATQNAIALCFFTYARLHAQDRHLVANPWSLARFAARQHRGGRVAGGHLNSKDAMSPYAAQRRGIKLLRLCGQDPQNCSWIDDVVDNRRARVDDIVAARVD